MKLAIIIVMVVIVLIVVGILVIYHDTHSFIVRRYEINTSKIKGDYTFVFLTDLHSYTFGEENKRLISAIDDLDPDVILCGGDMFIARKIKGELDAETGAHLLCELAKKRPVYAANGNHEEKIKLYTKEYNNFFDRYRSRLQRAGVIYLENQSVDIEGKNIRISGLDLDLDYFQKVTKKKMEPELMALKLGNMNMAEKNKLQVLIAHNPIYFEEYAKWGADVTVSGHVHGGIVRLPFLGGVISPAITLFPKYSGGKYELDGHTMILSCGLGTHTIHVRIFNPGEVSLIKIRGVMDVT
ncbi:MAG: metallophosphoesterase [Butyrivibrio sp.]|nr:metallophosphoesterase [Butyrivibrio sp.]